MDPDDLAWVRSWVGANPDDPTVDAIYARLGSRTAVAVEVLRTRRADLLAQPLSLTIPGDLSVSYGDNIKALDNQLAQLEALLVDEAHAATGGPTFAGARLVRRGGGWGR